MSDNNDGGPAFPLTFVYDPDRGECGQYVDANDAGVPCGMSLRDWFAGQAMAAMVASYRKVMRGVEDAQNDSEGDLSTPERDLLLDQNGQTGEYEGANEVASDAYIIADAMLAARKVVRSEDQ